MFDKIIQRKATGTTLIREIVSHTNLVLSQQISTIALERAKVTPKAPKIITTTSNMLQGRNLEEWMTLALGPQHVIGVCTHLFMPQDLTGTLIKKVKAEMIVDLTCRIIAILLSILMLYVAYEVFKGNTVYISSCPYPK
nr:uncharacterized protein LOC108944870 [Nicotiana tomentosiformis]